MKHLKTILTSSALAVATVFASCAGGTSQNKTAKFDNAADSASYAIGVLMGTQMHDQIIPVLEDFNLDNFVAGFQAVVNNDTANVQYKPQEAQQVFMTVMNRLAEAKAQKTLAEGKKFLEENAKKEGVKVIDSTGVQYIVLEEGDGAQPTIDDVVECDYVGTLIDGTEFDSSIKRGQPAQFPLKGVIPGWSKTIPLMKVMHWRRLAFQKPTPSLSTLWSAIKAVRKTSSSTAPPSPALMNWTFFPISWK